MNSPVISGDTFTPAAMGLALREHATQMRLSPVQAMAARRLAGETAFKVKVADRQEGRLEVVAHFKDSGDRIEVAAGFEARGKGLAIGRFTCSCGRDSICRHAVILGVHLESMSKLQSTAAPNGHWLDTLPPATVPGRASLPAEVDVLFRHGQPVTLGEQVRITSFARLLNPVPARLLWQVDIGNVQRLSCRATGLEDACIVASGAHAFALTPAGDLHPLDLGAAFVRALRAAPALSRDQASMLSTKTTAGSRIPKPLDLTNVVEETLRPRARARVVEVNITMARSNQMVPVEALELSFHYASPAGDPPIDVPFVRDGKVVRFVRDRREERDIVMRLAGRNMECLTTFNRAKEPDGPIRLVAARSRVRPEGGILSTHYEHCRALGIEVEVPQDWRLINAEELHLEIDDLKGMHGFALRIVAHDAQGNVDLTYPLVSEVRRADFPWISNSRDATDDMRITFSPSKGIVVSVPLLVVRSVGLPFREALEGVQVAKGDSVRISALQAVEFADALQGNDSPGARRMLAVIETIKIGRLPVESPQALQGTLRPYQIDGVSWLSFLASSEIGGVLADDMGLGKTLQILAHVLRERELGRLNGPVLIVAPPTIVPVWFEQAERFAPSLRLRRVTWNVRQEMVKGLSGTDLYVATYGVLANEEALFAKTNWALVVCDEAQTLKNPETQASRALRNIPRRHTVLTSGTPIENRLLDLWSIMDHAQSGVLGPRERFNRLYKRPIESGDPERLRALRNKIAPMILRRMKRDVAPELPPKSYQTLHVQLEGDQLAHYEKIRLGLRDRVLSEVRRNGLERSGIVVLDALLKLRQACCSPHLGGQRTQDGQMRSAKQEMLLERVSDLVQAGRKVLVFSQFAEMVDLISADLQGSGIPHEVMTGQTRDRASPVKRFMSGESPVMVLSLKVGNAGLNLQEADTVMLYDPWWNRSVEDQAEDRAHRIGQTQSVMVYRMICQGTVEERVVAIAARKKRLATALLDPDAAIEAGRWITLEEIDELFAPAADPTTRTSRSRREDPDEPSIDCREDHVALR